MRVLLNLTALLCFRENTFATGADSAVKRARKGGFAYITEEPILEYYNSRSPCDTMLVKHLLEAKSYGFALPKNSELTTNLSVNILDVSTSILSIDSSKGFLFSCISAIRLG